MVIRSCNPTIRLLGKIMARSLRIELAGGLYHVTSRGDRREDIFLCEGDRYVGYDPDYDYKQTRSRG